MPDITEKFHDAMAIRHDQRALRQQAEHDGYLYFRGLLDPGPILALRQAVLEVCARCGLLDETQPISAGVPRPGARLGQGFASNMV
jgi:hypothetical protein